MKYLIRLVVILTTKATFHFGLDHFNSSNKAVFYLTWKQFSLRHVKLFTSGKRRIDISSDKYTQDNYTHLRNEQKSFPEN